MEAIIMFLSYAAMTIFGSFSIILGFYAVYTGIIRGICDTFDAETRTSKKGESITSWFFGPCMLVFPFIFRDCFRQIVAQVRKIKQIWVAAMKPTWILKILLGPLGAILIAFQWPVGAILSLCSARYSPSSSSHSCLFSISSSSPFSLLIA